MAQTIKPDLKFINEVIAAGGESLKKCYQCATCTVVCNVTPAENPFPRKEMVHAQWGLKDRLFANPDIWLCHQCSDCTAYCPRGAKPGEVLNAVRKLSIEHYSVPSFLAKMAGDPKFLIPLLAVPAVIYLAIIGAQGFLSGTHIPTSEEGKIVFGKFLFSLKYIDPIFTAVAVLAVISLFAGLKRYWNAMSASYPAAAKGDFGGALTSAIKEIFLHERFQKCDLTRARKTAHMLVFYSFIGLFITTVFAFIRVIPEYIEYLKLSEIDPHMLDWLAYIYKPIGNISAAALIIGIVMIMVNRFKNQQKAGLGSYYDWLFIGLVLGVGVTGWLAQFLRLANTAVAYPTYVLHLCLVFFLFAYAPFSKTAHMFYRATAMVFSKMTQRQ